MCGIPRHPPALPSLQAPLPSSFSGSTTFPPSVAPPPSLLQWLHHLPSFSGSTTFRPSVAPPPSVLQWLHHIPSFSGFRWGWGRVLRLRCSFSCCCCLPSYRQRVGGISQRQETPVGSQNNAGMWSHRPQTKALYWLQNDPTPTLQGRPL
ncbi:hypothetical protein NHX12_016461 [Muraenolepis orangiensis]|uniref:Uncharacterized protein n=1 Tax=Muraenolepis orangiensis TaxID=630683 RepID=A0A9Q0D9S8_9TELE|nr:hypothetical protein NHX12_016461 [Muraenolepis orangiensis]